jgi:hypothetical protein
VAIVGAGSGSAGTAVASSTTGGVAGVSAGAVWQAARTAANNSKMPNNCFLISYSSKRSDLLLSAKYYSSSSSNADTSFEPVPIF